MLVICIINVFHKNKLSNIRWLFSVVLTNEEEKEKEHSLWSGTKMKIRKFAFLFLFSLILVVLSIWEFVQSSTFLAAGQSLRKLGCWMLVCSSKPLRRKHSVSAPRREVELKLSCGKQIHLSIQLMQMQTYKIYFNIILYYDKDKFYGLFNTVPQPWACLEV